MKNTGQLVFIDDSGDPGFKKTTSSSSFVLAAALFMNLNIATELNDTISEYRRSLGWTDEAEFKFRKTNKDIIKQVLKLACAYDFQIYAVYINKSELPNHLDFVTSKKSIYNSATKELLLLMPPKSRHR